MLCFWQTLVKMLCFQMLCFTLTYKVFCYAYESLLGTFSYLCFDCYASRITHIIHSVSIWQMNSSSSTQKWSTIKNRSNWSRKKIELKQIKKKDRTSKVVMNNKILRSNWSIFFVELKHGNQFWPNSSIPIELDSSFQYKAYYTTI